MHAYFLTLGGIDYIGLGNGMLQLRPGETNVQYMTIVNDTETEVSETVTLSLQTKQSRVSVLSGFDQTVVTIQDDDCK